MRSLFFFCIAACALLLPAGAVHAQEVPCASPINCFTSAIKSSRTLTVAYQVDAQNIIRPVQIQQCVGSQCGPSNARVQPAPDNRVDFNIPVPSQATFGVDSQGYRMVGSFADKSIRTEGFARIQADYVWNVSGALPVSDYTIAVTFYDLGPNDGKSHRLFSMISENSPHDHDDVFTASWDSAAGKLVFERGQPGQGGESYTVDAPWDMTRKVINEGIPPFNNHTGRWKTSPAEPFPRLVELYFRFRRDGKVRVDMATLMAYSPELLVSHTQDMGLYVRSYPRQRATEPFKCRSLPHDSPDYWCPAEYARTSALWLGDTVTQISVFNKLLTDNEVMGFHVSNLYYKAIRTPYNLWSWFNTEPCNSGAWMNLTRFGTLSTPCGSRYGTHPG